tara:strand:+ start:875 stop:994 length:120 start_codon:yes stop_codon:yes gene_type:complete
VNKLLLLDKYLDKSNQTNLSVKNTNRKKYLEKLKKILLI